MSYKDGFGLREKQDDGTEFRVGSFIRLLPKSQLPKKFIVPVPDEWVRAQAFDTCADEALSVLLSHLNGYLVDATYTWTLARANNGYAIEDYGITIKEILMAAVKAGAPKYSESQYHSNDDRNTFADITKWDLKDQQPKAMVNKAGSAVFIEPTDGMDLFDTIRSTVATLNAPVLWGMRWNYDMHDPMILKPSETGYGHCKLILGYDDERADILDMNISLNSWGLTVGVNGRYFVSRELVNHDAAIFGAGTLIDETPEKVKWYIDNGIYLNDGNWLLNTAKALILAMKQALNLRFKASEKPKTIGIPPYPTKVVRFCEQIRKHEGWAIGSRSRRNHNPGNVKYIGQYKAIGKDAGGFAIFPDDATGWEYLMRMVYNHFAGKSPLYNRLAKDKFGLTSAGEMTLYQYFNIYCEEDPTTPEDDDKTYAEVVAEELGVSPYLLIKELL